MDKVIDELKNRNEVFTTKGLFKTPQRYGYHRYFATENLGLNFALKLDLWQHFSDTPFWLGISNVGYSEISNKLRVKIENLCVQKNLVFIPYANEKGVFVGLKPLLYETEDVVIRDFADNIEKITKQISE